MCPLSIIHFPPMFPSRYFPNRAFAPRYFPKLGAAAGAAGDPEQTFQSAARWTVFESPSRGDVFQMPARGYVFCTGKE